MRLILGTKLSHNDYSHFEVQPSVRSIWNVDENNSVWAAVSRAVRTPSRAENDIMGTVAITPAPGVGPVTSVLEPNRSFEAENLIAYEFGIRTTPHRSVQFDLATFYFDYDDLSGSVSGAPSVDMSGPFPLLTTPVSIQNVLEGESYGAELLTNVQATDWWRIQSSYSFFKINLSSTLPGMMVGQLNEEDQDPQHQMTFRSLIDLPWSLELDAFLRYVDRLSDHNIDAYTELDLRLGWRATDNLSFDIIGNNLLDDDHDEFDDVYPTGTNTLQERAVFGRVTIQLP